MLCSDFKCSIWKKNKQFFTMSKRISEAQQIIFWWIFFSNGVERARICVKVHHCLFYADFVAVVYDLMDFNRMWLFALDSFDNNFSYLLNSWKARSMSTNNIFFFFSYFSCSMSINKRSVSLNQHQLKKNGDHTALPNRKPIISVAERMNRTQKLKKNYFWISDQNQTLPFHSLNKNRKN